MNDFRWTILLPPLLGFAGIYALLPQARRSRPLLGAGLGGLALVLAGWILIQNHTVLPETILFYAFSALAIIGGTLMLGQRNPVHAALSFAVVVLSTAGLFLLLAAPFLMAATIIIYAGAIIVTFLFVIMLAQQSGMTSADQRSREPFLASLGGFLLVGALLCILEKTYDMGPTERLLQQVHEVSTVTTEADIKRLLGDPAGRPLGRKSAPIIEELARAFPHFDRKRLDDIDDYLNSTPVPVAKVTAVFREVEDYGQRHRGQVGALEPAATIKLSPFSGTPPNVQTKDRQLPARNVAGLGRTLFADYLLPVELGGVLLLVASIGAIAIAGRRTEGLR